MCADEEFLFFLSAFCFALCALSSVSILRCALVKRRDDAPAKIKSWKVKVELWKGCKMLKGSRGTRASCRARGRGWRYNPFSGLTFALSAAFRTCSLALPLSASRSLYICVCILFLMFCFLTLAVICSARVCVCESAVWERVRVVVCRLCLALFITQPNDEFIFLCFVFFSHARHVQLVILCAYHRMSYFACLPQRRRRRRRWRQPALACLLSLPVLFVFLSPLLAGQQKSKMMCYGVTWHVSYMLLLRRVVGLGGFCFFFYL